ncbi:alpha/beta hydrolase [Hymenobacter sp. BT186]|uniref:Alpha/beta hydrolase n=1 Tax=Hymenobacter telluris TaxID=2816474 RepID=A0A939EX49_9BACT|nr:alpha/beta hydrolase [Hymenobacter telluris]MBO0359043.1 alpha/beta hydrolase [Hymenobacter telluris]MBW3375069.1 alpha/beta hydrolase [Hymenobacter norwichensis]
MNTPSAPSASTQSAELDASVPVSSQDQYSDQELVKKLPGFTNHYVSVNGIRLHYVEGGSGQPLICLPGWPQTWYSFHPVATQLAQRYRVILLDIRGMGSTEKPATGYDKKTMAQDVYALTQLLNLPKVTLMGHDIGGMVAMSFAFNYPEATAKLILLDGSHPSEGMRHMAMLPAPGTFEAKMDGNNPYMWWMAFNQIKELPEQLLAGRFRYLLDWLFKYVMIDERHMTEFDREVYAAAYNQPESIRAATAWYQAFNQDMADASTYPRLTMPVLGIASYVAYNHMNMGLPYVAENVQVVGLLDSGHYMFEEKPDLVLEAVFNFMQ